MSRFQGCIKYWASLLLNAAIMRTRLACIGAWKLSCSTKMMGPVRPKLAQIVLILFTEETVRPVSCDTRHWRGHSFVAFVAKSFLPIVVSTCFAHLAVQCLQKCSDQTKSLHSYEFFATRTSDCFISFHSAIELNGLINLPYLLFITLECWK